MGWDILGVVEGKKEGRWYSVISLDFLVRDYGMFGLLFGVKSPLFKNPVAANRGLPDDISYNTKQQYMEFQAGVNATWIVFSEIQNIDWNTKGYSIYQQKEYRASEFLTTDWIMLFAMMQAMAGYFEDVRMVVWFSC